MNTQSSTSLLIFKHSEHTSTDIQKWTASPALSSENSDIRGVPGRQLLQFAGTIHTDDLKLMRQIIEEGCEKIDLDGW